MSTVDDQLAKVAAMAEMVNVTVLLGLFLFACDLMTRADWRKRVWLTITVTTASVALFGAATIGFGLATTAYVAFFMLFLTGVFDAVSVVAPV